MKKSQILKFLVSGRPTLPCGPVISGQGLKIKISLPTNFSFRHSDSKKVWQYPSKPKSHEEIDLAETAVLQGPVPAMRNFYHLFKLKILFILFNIRKLFHFFTFVFDE